jgi:hypothetical protein
LFISFIPKAAAVSKIVDWNEKMDPPSSILVGEGTNAARKFRNRGYSLGLERLALQISLDEKSNRDMSGTAIEDAEDKPSQHTIFPVGQLDEVDPKFDDDKESIVQRWGDIVEAAVTRLSVEGSLLAKSSAHFSAKD